MESQSVAPRGFGKLFKKVERIAYGSIKSVWRKIDGVAPNQVFEVA